MKPHYASRKAPNMHLGALQNSPAEAEVCFSPPLSRFVQYAAPTVRRQGAQACPLTVLVCAADALQQDGSSGCRKAMGIFNCRHVQI